MSKFKYKMKRASKKFVSKHNNKKYSENLYKEAFNREIDWENPTYGIVQINIKQDYMQSVVE